MGYNHFLICLFSYVVLSLGSLFGYIRKLILISLMLLLSVRKVIYHNLDDL